MLKLVYLVHKSIDMQDFFNQIISYHDLINGPLVPNKLDALKVADYLNSEQMVCKDMIVGKFKKVGNEFKLIEELRISTVHPLADSFFIKNEIDFPNNPSTLISPRVFELLNLNHEKIKNDYVYKKQNGVDIIGVALESEWSEIENDRLSYGYINFQLKDMEAEHIKKLRKLALNSTDEVIKKTIVKLQSIFNSYLTEIINEYQLKPIDLNIKLKQSYNRKDCAILVYRSIVKVLDFLTTMFYNLLDLSQQIPYYSKLLNENHFVDLSKGILKQLKKVELDDRFRAIIENEINKVLSFDISNRINYNNFEAYKGFLKGFDSFLKKANYTSISQEEIINFLISINLKKKSFLTFITDDIKSSLYELASKEEQSILLSIKQKNFEQALLSAEFHSKVDEDHLALKLIKWIDVELSYLDQTYNFKLSGSSTNPFQKLSSSLNIKEIAVLCRLFKEVGSLNKEKVTDISNWIPNAITNKSNIEYSSTSIRNKMYNMDKKSFERVKSLIFKMYNFKYDDFHE